MKRLMLGLILLGGLLTASLPFIGLNNGRIIEHNLHGPVNVEMAEEFRLALDGAGRRDTVRLHIETFGGLVLSANKIMHYLRNTEATVICTVDSHAMSAGAMILSTCDTVDVKDHAEILFHTYQVCSAKDFLGNCSERSPVSPTFHPEIYKEATKALEIVRHLLTEKEWNDMIAGKDIVLKGNVFMDRFKGVVRGVEEYTK